MRAFSLVCLAAALSGALSQSVKSCGGPSDHLKNAVIKLSPDPPVAGKPFSILTSGNLDEPLDALSSSLSIDASIGPIHSKLAGDLPITFSPSAPQGNFTFNIGPFQLPAEIPNVKGQIHFVDGKKEPVFCLDLDLKSEDEPEQPLRAAEPADITSCSKPSDHLKHLNITHSGGIATIAGDLDEALTKAAVDIDVKIKVLFASVPVKLTIPVEFSTGFFQTGPFQAKIGPSTVTMTPAVKATASGTVKFNDGKGEEVFCLSLAPGAGVATGGLVV